MVFCLKVKYKNDAVYSRSSTAAANKRVVLPREKVAYISGKKDLGSNLKNKIIK
jgi:hypothetical protein